MPDSRLISQLSLRGKTILKHWVLVDWVLPSSFPLIVLSSIGRVEFSAMFLQVRLLRDALADARQAQKIAYQALLNAKKALFVRMKQFRVFMVGYWQQTVWFSALPVLPAVRAGRQEFLEPMKFVALLWPKIAAQPPPVPGVVPVMHDGYSAEDFARDLAGVVELWDAVGVCNIDVKIENGRTVQCYQRMAAAIMAYGHSARGRLEPGDPLLARIPRTWGRRKTMARNKAKA